MTDILKVMKIPNLTEEEYNALDEKWTKNPPKPGPNGTGFFSQRKKELAIKSIFKIINVNGLNYLTNVYLQCIKKHGKKRIKKS